MKKKKVVAIDINDVVRDLSNRFISLYKKNIDKKFNDSQMSFKDNDFFSAFDMSKMDMNEFMYIDFPLEIFGFAPEVKGSVGGLLNIWISNLSDYETYPEVILISCGENEKSLPATLFFLSKTGIQCRKIIFPQTSTEVWQLADVIITANTKLIESKPRNKKVIKIKTPYNESVQAKYEYNSIVDLIGLDDKSKTNKKFNKIVGIC